MQKIRLLLGIFLAAIAVLGFRFHLPALTGVAIIASLIWLVPNRAAIDGQRDEEVAHETIDQPIHAHTQPNGSPKYLIVLGLLGGLALLLGIKDFALLLVFVTLGLGFPLLYAATAFIYMLCLLPIVYFWNDRSLRPIASLVSVAAVIAVACLPAYFSNKQADAYAARLATYQIKPTPNQKFRTVEIQQESNSISQFNDGNSNSDGCNEVCASLLENGEADWVRIVSNRNRYSKDINGDSTLYVSGSGEACRVPGGSSSPPQHCVLVQADDYRQAAVVLTLQAGYGDGLIAGKDARGTPANGWRRITAYAGTDTEYSSPFMRMHEQNYDTVLLPTIIGPAFSGMSSGGYELAYYQIKLAPLDLISAMRSVGFKVDIAPKATPDSKKYSWQGEPTDADIRAALSVLNLPTSDAFSHAENSALDQWVTHARNYKDWNGERLDIATRIYKDPRVGFAGFFNQVFTKPDVAKIILPLALNEVQNSDISKPRDVLKSVLWAIPQVDAETLKANLPQILSIIQTDKTGQFNRSFIFALSLAGENPLPYLAKLAHEDEDRNRSIAVCLAQPVGAPAYIAELHRLLKKQNVSGTRPNDVVGIALYALVIHGDDEFVKNVIDNSTWRHKEQMMAQITGFRDYERGRPPYKCLG